MAFTVFIEGICAGPEGALPTFTAERVGEPWNGWATPVVAREQVEGFRQWVHVWEPGMTVCLMPEGIYVERPNEGEVVVCPEVEGGGYSLAPLGWVFEAYEVPEVSVTVAALGSAYYLSGGAVMAAPLSAEGLPQWAEAYEVAWGGLEPWVEETVATTRHALELVARELPK